jgi:hypothetical protein
MKGVVASAHIFRKFPLKCRLTINNCTYHQISGRNHRFLLSSYRNDREFSSESLLEREKHMFLLRRRMMALYQSGKDYKGALGCAIELKDSVAACEELGGKRSSIYASSLNNVALMVGKRFRSAMCIPFNSISTTLARREAENVRAECRGDPILHGISSDLSWPSGALRRR